MQKQKFIYTFSCILCPRDLNIEVDSITLELDCDINTETHQDAYMSVIRMNHMASCFDNSVFMMEDTMLDNQYELLGYDVFLLPQSDIYDIYELMQAAVTTKFRTILEDNITINNSIMTTIKIPNTKFVWDALEDYDIHDIIDENDEDKWWGISEPTLNSTWADLNMEWSYNSEDATNIIKLDF